MILRAAKAALVFYWIIINKKILLKSYIEGINKLPKLRKITFSYVYNRNIEVLFKERLKWNKEKLVC